MSIDFIIILLYNYNYSYIKEREIRMNKTAMIDMAKAICGWNNMTMTYNREDHIANRYYIAYGSNMCLERLKKRCADSEYVGTGILSDYKLLFRKSASGFYASIDKAEKEEVPVVVFRISKADENMLDKYEGCPTWYRKEKMTVILSNGKSIKGIVYKLPEDSAKIGIPTNEYYNIISNAYKSLGLNEKVLERALLFSFKRGDPKDLLINKSTSRQQSLGYNYTANYNPSYKTYKVSDTKKSKNKSNKKSLKSNYDTFYKRDSRQLFNEIRVRLQEEVDKVFPEEFDLGFSFKNQSLEVIDTESMETLFVIYNIENNECFYIENVLMNDYADFDLVDDAIAYMKDSINQSYELC